jgi:hypothetical protein
MLAYLNLKDAGDQSAEKGREGGRERERERERAGL